MFTHFYTLRPYCNLPTQKKKHENKTKQNWFAATFRDQTLDYDKNTWQFFEFTVSITNQNL